MKCVQGSSVDIKMNAAGRSSKGTQNTEGRHTIR